MTDSPTPPRFQITGPADEFIVSVEHSGLVCVLCSERPLVDGDMAVRLPTDQGERLHHAACFYFDRAQGLEQQLQAVTEMLQANHKMLCMVLAKTGEVRVFPHQMERAAQAGFSIDTKNMPDGGMTLKLKGASDLVVAKKMPPRRLT